MERLIEIVNGIPTYIGKKCHYSVGLTAGEMPPSATREVMDRLAAYEDTGVEPEEVKRFEEEIELRFLLWVEKHYGISGGRLMELAGADKEGQCVVLPEVSEQDRKGMADFLHDCFADWTHDPDVGLYGMTDGEAALANAIMAALTRAEAEAALHHPLSET